MATDRERMLDDAEANGFNRRAVLDGGGNDYAQRAYMALKLFQIEEHLRRIAASADLIQSDESTGIG